MAWLIDRTAGQEAVRGPVEDLRQALRVPAPDATENRDVLTFREQSVRKCVHSLRTIGQMRQALLLIEWRDVDRDENVAAVNRRLRAELATRFQNEVRRALRDDDPGHRMAAANVLAGLGTGDPEETVRSAARALAPELVQLVRTDKDRQVRVAAARALGQVNPTIRKPGAAPPDDVIPSLARLLAQGEVVERRAAAEALTSLVRTILHLLKIPGESSQQTLRSELLVVAAGIVPVVARGLHDADAEVRRQATEGLQQAAIALGELLPDPRPATEFPPPGRKWTARERQDIEQYARQLANEQADTASLVSGLADQVPGLAGLLRDANLKVAVSAGGALEALATAQVRLEKRIGGFPTALLAEGESQEPGRPPKSDPRLRDRLREALPALTATLAAKDRDVEVRLASLYVLETLEIEARPAAKALLGALKDDNSFIRWGAVRALGKMASDPPAGAAGGLGGALLDDNQDVRLSAFAALQRYGPAAGDAVPGLVRALDSPDAEMRLLTLQTLAAIGKNARPAAPALVMALSAKEARVRHAAAVTLGKLGPAEGATAAALRQALSDPDAAVREAAGIALLGDQ
jgi:HEAT repeat protein